MARPNAIVVPITSEMDEPVIIDSPETQKATETPKAPATEETKDAVKGIEDEEKAESDYESDAEREPRYNRRSPIIYNSRNYSPPPRPRGFASRIHEVPILVDTSSLNEFIKMNDVCADTPNNQMIYIANHPFHAADIDKISWVFKAEAEDKWVQKPVVKEKGRERSRSRGRYEGYYEDRYDDFDGPINRRNTPIVRLGTALRVFKTDEKKYGTEKVKFVIVVKGKGNAGWMKLVVAHSRQAAMVDIFHEILKGYEILFVGAVLQEAVIPAEKKDKAVRFQRVGSLKEAQEIEKGQRGVIGVIC